MNKYQTQVQVRYEPGAFAEQLGAGEVGTSCCPYGMWTEEGGEAPANCHGQGRGRNVKAGNVEVL